MAIVSPEIATAQPNTSPGLRSASGGRTGGLTLFQMEHAKRVLHTTSNTPPASSSRSSIRRLLASSAIQLPARDLDFVHASADIRKESEPCQLEAQRGSVGELNRAKTEGRSRLDVRGQVVDEERIRGFDAELLDEVREDPRVGLVHSDVRRDDNPLEPCQEVEPLSGERERLRRPVAERDKSDSRGA